jgi:hypothetical protein
MKNNVCKFGLWDKMPTEAGALPPALPTCLTKKQEVRMQATYIISDDAGDTVCNAPSVSEALASLADTYGLEAHLETIEGLHDLRWERAIPVIAPLGFTLRRVVAE